MTTSLFQLLKYTKAKDQKSHLLAIFTAFFCRYKFPANTIFLLPEAFDLIFFIVQVYWG